MKNLTQLSSSKLPTEFGHYTIYVFQDRRTSIEHTALVMGAVNSTENVLTRIHSECLTGDIFSSLRCDCGEQLKLSQQKIAEAGTGILIYLRDHEGRGIGLANKIRAYKFQDNGLDTVDANIALGLPVDNRSFEIAAEILDKLKIRSIRLMSNNPDKFNALTELGININSQIPLNIKPNECNIQYLHTKKIRLGHLITNY